MKVGESDIRRVIEHIWTLVLDLDVEPVPLSVKRPLRGRVPAGLPRDLLTCCIRLTGAWQGMLLVDIPAALACRAASRMFGVAPEEATAEQIHDALRELTNIIGGNFKALVPGPSTLSMPTVTHSSDDAIDKLDPQRLIQAGFQCQNQPFLVSVIESN